MGAGLIATVRLPVGKTTLCRWIRGENRLTRPDESDCAENESGRLPALPSPGLAAPSPLC